MMKKSAIIIFLLGFFALAYAGKSVVIDSLQVDDGNLTISYHINDLLGEKGMQALQRGITAEVVHHIQLWRKKGFINPLEKEYIYKIKIVYDNWERKYRIITKDEKRLTAQLETVKEKCTVLQGFPVAAIADLQENQKYFISISVTFQPISAESYNAVSDIFSRDENNKEENKKSGYLGILVNLLGFGDKEFSSKSFDFTITDTGTIRLLK